MESFFIKVRYNRLITQVNIHINQSIHIVFCQSAFVEHESKHVEEIPESNSTNVVKDITTEDQICQRDGEGVIEDNINPSNEPSSSDSIEKRLHPKIEDIESSYTPGLILLIFYTKGILP